MADEITEYGITTSTLTELTDDLETDFKSIYGDDINLDSNSPDGQIINIFAQAGIDLRELATDIYNSFNPDVASGSVLDERVTINSIARKGGTYTIQPIDIVVDRTVNLSGLDDDYYKTDGTGYTIQDDEGNEFILIDSQELTAGSHTVNFRASTIGEVNTTVDTLTSPVTIVLGVVSVNNSSGASEIGEDQETDAELRVRRSLSVSNDSSGYLNGLLGSILEIDGVTDGKLYENYTNSVDADGIPAHGIWAIVEGGSSSDIANIIYAKKSYGSNMKGDIEVSITTASGGIFTALFDRPVSEDLYIKFDLQTTTAGTIFDTVAIKESIVSNLSYDIGDFAETSTITCIAKAAIDNNGDGGVPVNVEISLDDITYSNYIEVSSKQNQFTISTDNITITEL